MEYDHLLVPRHTMEAEHAIMRIFRSTIALAIVGAIIIGGFSAILAVRSIEVPAATASTLASASSGTTLKGTPNGQAQSPTPTSTTPPPTLTSTPTIAGGCGGSSVDWRGVIISVNRGASTFAFDVNGTSYTISITSQTSYSGGVGSFGDLSPNMPAHVHATQCLDGSYQATNIDVQQDS